MRWILLDALVFVPCALFLEWLESWHKGDLTELADYGWWWIPFLFAGGVLASVVYRLWIAHKRKAEKPKSKSLKRAA